MSELANQDRLAVLDRARELLGDRADVAMGLARQYAAVGCQAKAVELANAALDGAPGDGEIRALAGEVLAQTVPDWHFVITRDQVRNQAYAGALARVVTPDTLVLEIGTGTGLLAMMAARLGARVVTCEANAAIAAAAREVITANGLADRISVVNKHSTALDLMEDLGRRADVLVSEIVSNDMLSEQVLPSHADAALRLIRPDAHVIPARGRIRAALAHDARAGTRLMDQSSGFDLSAFNRLARVHYEIRVADPRLALRSSPADLFTLAFDGSQPSRDGRTTLELVSSGGPVNGVVQWLALDMDELGLYENEPGRGESSCWASLFWPFAAPLDTKPGDVIRIGGYHTQERVRLWRQPD
ncbi:50S ribosomal protein L11 methyltransferase [Novosphingobium sp. TH158]|uniref:50S ribosomal protein L11 methyltransferase n=1 Tax=Novosphingobium sp. TH158 TaxID=2067455 RepID=UPI0013044DB1|nr:50S ribosomal protein L11 methyltransferase [Novosphingobium sp. TH158]